jgi:hypothetical protein
MGSLAHFGTYSVDAAGTTLLIMWNAARFDAIDDNIDILAVADYFYFDLIG